MRTEVMGALRPQTVEPVRHPVKPKYLEALNLIERLHRRLLDVIKDDFERSGEPEVNPVQALLLFNIADSELTAGEEVQRAFGARPRGLLGGRQIGIGRTPYPHCSRLAETRGHSDLDAAPKPGEIHRR